MATADKIIALAFHANTPEHEAINAFLAIRRDPDALKVVLGQSAPVKRWGNTCTWEVKLHPHAFDAFLDALTSYKDEPYFTIRCHKGLRKKLIDMWEFELKVRFDTPEKLNDFKTFFGILWDEVTNKKR